MQFKTQTKTGVNMNKVTTLLCAFLVVLIGVANSNAQGVFISEYIEGSSQNKAIEIFNGTDGDVNLSNYIMMRANNGATSWQDTLRFTGTLAKGEVYVIGNPSSSGVDPAIIAAADTLDDMTFVNGDDAIGLFSISGTDTTLIDLFGALGVDPGSAWDVGSTAGGTSNQTLVRKPTIYSGNPDSVASFGTDDMTSEWIVSAQNDFSDLGSHTVSLFDVTFQADMRDIIDSAAFIPGTDFVSISGAINGWSTSADTLTDVDSDGIYAITVPEVRVGSYDYKLYLHTSRISGGYELDGQPNRNVTVTDADVTVTPVEPVVPYTDLNNAVFGNVQLYFQVDMNVQILNGTFDPSNANQSLQVAGDFNGWNTTANTLSEGQTSGVYETTVNMGTNVIPSNWVHKFVIRTDGNDAYEDGSNKPIGVTANSLVGSDYIGINHTGTIPFFNNVTLDDIFASDASVIFEVDMRPAFYFAEDSTDLPDDFSTGAASGTSVNSVFINGSLVNKVGGGWEDWGNNLSLRTDLQLSDDGSTGGDLVAGDSVYTITIDYVAGENRRGAFKFSANGFDNENGFGNDHVLKVDGGERYSLIFGAVSRADSVHDEVYDEYILVTESGAEVVRRGGKGDNGITVSNEDEFARPSQFVLEQNYPNPFNPSTKIQFTLPAASNVNLTVYNMLGQRVASLVDGNRMSQGTHTINFNASNLSSGMYIYRIEAGEFVSTKKMMLIK